VASEAGHLRALTPQQELISELDAAAGQLDQAIAGLTDENASHPGPDRWSVKDHLTHVTFWHEMRFFEMSRIARGGRPAFQHMDEETVTPMNELNASNRRRLTLSQVTDDLNFAREMVKQAIIASPEDRLDVDNFEEMGPNGAGHEIQHAAQIAELRTKEGI
jgi:hypothetical protein